MCIPAVHHPYIPYIPHGTIPHLPVDLCSDKITHVHHGTDLIDKSRRSSCAKMELNTTAVASSKGDDAYSPLN